jgi:hypothetical protein
MGVLSNTKCWKTLLARYLPRKNSKGTTHGEQNPSVSCKGTARFIRAKFVMNN